MSWRLRERKIIIIGRKRQTGDPLPQELLDLFIDNLGDELENLRSCALVSSAFLPSSRARIFSHIRVDTDLALEELQRLLEDLPSLAARVESLHLGGNGVGWIPSWPGSSKAHWQFSSLFVSLVRLCISIAVEWTSISENFRNSIQLTLRSPTVTCVELAGLVGLPLAFLAHCPALRSLTLTRVFFHDPDNFDFTAALAACADSPPTQLEHLDLALDTWELDFLARWILIPESPTRHRTPPLICPGPSINACGDWLRSSSSRCPPHTFALVLNIVTPNARPETVQLAGADGFLAGLQCITSVTVLLFPPRRPRVPKLIDVSDSFEQEMPLLANRLGKGALRVLRSSQVAET
ncbi:hypothetical protein B0H14DRAFT_3489576 [Mycena olivaceomarginata]|nr:hypothetical protein B0H14DRAFT_3489576 [Mycena olivaceomarginata]